VKSPGDSAQSQRQDHATKGVAAGGPVARSDAPGPRSHARRPPGGGPDAGKRQDGLGRAADSGAGLQLEKQVPPAETARNCGTRVLALSSAKGGW